MKTKALAKEDRKNQILLAFAVELQAGREARMTSVDIARKIGLAPSKHVRDFIRELVIEGLLDSTKEPMTGAVGYRWVYTPTDMLDTRNGKPKHEPRTILIKTRKNGQLALFTEVLS